MYIYLYFAAIAHDDPPCQCPPTPLRVRLPKGVRQSPATSAGLFQSPSLPSCPSRFQPQHLTRPPLTITHVCLCPRAMATAETPALRERDKNGVRSSEREKE